MDDDPSAPPSKPPKNQGPVSTNLDDLQDHEETTPRSSTGEAYRNVLNKIAVKFRRPNYPLGISSFRSEPSNSSVATGGYLGSHLNSSITSPMKEKHQATLVTSGSGSSSSSSNAGSDTNINSNNSNNSQNSTTYCSQQKANFELNRKNLNLRPVSSPSGGSANQAERTRATLLQVEASGHGHGREEGAHNLHQTASQTSSEYAQYSSGRGGGTDVDDDSHQLRELALWRPYARASSPLHHCSPSVSLASSESGSDSDDRNIILDSCVTMAITRSMEHQMKVRLADPQNCHNNLKKDYQMTARPRGPCLIVNNVDFDADIFPTRKGSDEDAKRFDYIFSELGFTVINKRNQTADEMKKLFKEVASQCKPEHNALFVFILSHGSEHGIYGKDGFEVHRESEIISCFDNRNCEVMKGKPKVFVIQACRGGGKDYGGDETTDSIISWPPQVSAASAAAAAAPSLASEPQGSMARSQSRSSQDMLARDFREYPIRTDMLVVFSCLAGYVSVRNETAGSWLGTSLAFYIMKYAYKEDFLRILNRVTEDVTGRKSSQGLVQSIEVRQLGWKKNLYFNPGIYLSDFTRSPINA